MDTLKLGQLITGEQQRDATHIAVAPIIAGERLTPGEHVGLNKKGEACGNEKYIGVVDPFLAVRYIQPGEKFWLFLYPGSITGLRHEWTHPAFTTAVINGRTESEQWIHDFATKHGEDFSDIMDAARAYKEHGNYLVRGGKFEGEYVPDEFWTHYDNITGETTTNTGSFFSCSCSC